MWSLRIGFHGFGCPADLDRPVVELAELDIPHKIYKDCKRSWQLVQLSGEATEVGRAHSVYTCTEYKSNTGTASYTGDASACTCWRLQGQRILLNLKIWAGRNLRWRVVY